jgi:hypothetical protein
MKIKALLAVVFAMTLLGLAGCQNAQPQEQPSTSVATTATDSAPAEPTTAATSTVFTTLPPTVENTLPPTETVEPSATPTVQVVPTTAEPSATATAVAATEAAPATTPTDAASAAQADLQPVEGLWTGSATNLLLTFQIAYQDGQVMLSDLGVLWFGRGDCTIDRLVVAATPIQPEEFTRFYKDDDIRYELTGRVDSATLIVGKITVQAEGCGSHILQWMATPKQP